MADQDLPAAVPDERWPADRDAVERARHFLLECAGSRTAIVCDSDVDGLAAAVIVERALLATRAEPHLLPVRRGEHVHQRSMRERILTAEARRLVVLDLGSRPEPIGTGLATLIIDHHHAAAGLPPDAIVLNGYDRTPVATASVLAFIVTAPLTERASVAWLAAIGAVGDLGSATIFKDVLGVRTGGAHWRQATALLNAARRAPNPDPSVALDALRAATSVSDIVSGRVPQTTTLERMRDEVRAETDRCARFPPRIFGTVAVIRFSSGAQVHPVVAIRWAGRLRPRIVLVANDGYLPGRTNFAVRCADDDVDLIAWLRGLPFRREDEGEFANGHARATGGSLSPADFDRLLAALRPT